jgi:hypothetical protein
MRVDEWMKVRVKDAAGITRAGIVMSDFQDQNGRSWYAGDVVVLIDGDQVPLTFDAFLSLFEIQGQR